jgi:uncharacterized protein YebE (UPF0316 family)
VAELVAVLVAVAELVAVLVAVAELVALSVVIADSAAVSVSVTLGETVWVVVVEGDMDADTVNVSENELGVADPLNVLTVGDGSMESVATGVGVSVAMTDLVAAVTLPSGLLDTVFAIDTDELAELLGHAEEECIGVCVTSPVVVWVPLEDPLRLVLKEGDTVSEGE